MHRRHFLKTGAAAAIALAGRPGQLAAADPTDRSIPKRPLGSTGERLTIFGFGGTAVMSLQQSDANELVAEAFDRGVNFYDVSPTYGDAQERLGPALEPYRQRVFLASKTDFRDRAGAEADLARSLKTLRTDHFDLYQHHALDTLADWERVLRPDGAHEALLSAKREGRIRFLGMCTHSVEVAVAAIDHGGFDTLLFPVNYVLALKSEFGPEVIERARRKGIGILAIKGMARGKYSSSLPQAARTPKCWYEPCTLPSEAALAFRWTLSQPITLAIPPGNPEWYRLALSIARDFKPITEAETTELRAHLEGADPLFGRT